LGDLIDRGRADGAFRTDLPAEWLTTSFFGLAHAAADEVRTERMPAGAAREAFATSIQELFIGPRGRL
jgi:TetR/AcrR family transcriptional regulator, mexCD-oprJ operon repressor